MLRRRRLRATRARSSEHFACQLRRSTRKPPAPVLEDECGELGSGVGRAGLEPVRRRLEPRRQFPKRLQRGPPLTGFDAADVRIVDARLAEVPLREVELSPPLADAVTDRAWIVAHQAKGRSPGVGMAVLACACQRFSVGCLNGAPPSGSRRAHRPAASVAEPGVAPIAIADGALPASSDRRLRPRASHVVPRVRFTHSVLSLFRQRATPVRRARTRLTT
jgi:hypothetical protein